MYLEAAGVLEEVLLEEDLTAGETGEVGAGAGRHHDAALDLEGGGADVLELDHARIVGIAPRVVEHVFALLRPRPRYPVALRHYYRHFVFH